MRIVLSIIVLLFPCFLFASPVITFKEPGVLNVISYSEFKPISYGNGQGYEADLLKAVAKHWGIKIKFSPENIYQGIWRLPSRSYTKSDVAIGGITPTNERKKEGAYFSVISTAFNQSLLVRKKDVESGRIISYQSFKNSKMKIGVVPGTTGEQYAHLRAKENGLPLSVFAQYTSESELLPALLQGKIAAIARGEIGNEYQASLHKDLMTIAKKNFHEGFSIAVDKSNITLLQQINQAIQEITDHGKITYSQWLANHNVFLQRVQALETIR